VPETIAAVARLARERTPIDDVTVVAVHRRTAVDDPPQLPAPAP